VTKKPVFVLAGLAALVVAAAAVSTAYGKSAPRTRDATASVASAGEAAGQPPAGAGQPGVSAGGPAGGRSAMPCEAAGSVPGSSGSSGSSGSASASPGVVAPAQTATHLFTRTTSDGVTIRVYRVSSGPILGCGSSAGGQTMFVPVCGGDRDMVEMSDTAAVGQGELAVDEPVPVTASTPLPAHVVSLPASGAFGVLEGDPVWWVAVQVDTGVTGVEADFADGTTDVMAPVNGVVALAHHVTVPGGSDPSEVQATLRLLDGGGGVIGTVPVPSPAPTPVPVPDPAPAPAGTVPLATAPPATPPSPASGGGTTANSGGSTGGAGGSGGSAASGSGSSSSTAIACPLVPAPSQAHS